MRIVVASDHAALDLKAAVVRHLEDLGHAVTDIGTHTADSTDYPIWGAAAAKLVVSGDYDRGIVFCGTGLGIGIAANKVAGARCATCTEPFSATLARAHNNANMLALGARVLGPDLANACVDAFLATDFLGGRHARRVEELATLDAGDDLPLPAA